MTIHTGDNGLKTLSSAVARAITHSGMEVLNSETRLYSLVSDFLGNSPQSKLSLNLLLTAIECGIPARLYGAVSKDKAEQTIVIATCRKLLMDNYNTGEVEAGQFMREFAIALGWNVVLAMPSANKESPVKQINATVIPTTTSTQSARAAAPTFVPQPPSEDPRALYEKGKRCYEGNGVKQSYPDAVAYFRKAASRGLPEAQLMLGECYFKEHGVQRDHKEALSWVKQAALQGFPPAQMKMGDCYHFGIGVQKDISKAIEWYQAAGKQGYVAAQYELAYTYYSGNDVVQNHREAAAWFQKAAELGDARAQKLLAECYWHGRGVNQDDRKAAQWYRASAEQGNDDGIAGLGTCYYYGRGVPKDLSEAKRLFQKAADLGNPSALIALMQL